MDKIQQSLTSNFKLIKARTEQMDVETLARQTGVIKRTPRKLSASGLLQVIIALSSGRAPTQEEIAAAASLLLDDSYSKEAVRKRLNNNVDVFLAAIIAAVFADMTKDSAGNDNLKYFNRVILQDSTNIALPEKFSSVFPGSPNQSSSNVSSMKIQLITDMLQGNILDLSISGFTRNDQAAAPDILKIAQAGDLVLRDMGYFVLKTFEHMIQRNIFFISLCRKAITIHDPRNGQRIDLASKLKKQRSVDIDVLLGMKDQVAVRLTAEPVSEAVANERRRKARANAKRDKRLNPSKDSFFLMGWNIFITNIPRDKFTAKQLYPVYALRWRIEIIFKAWKSHLAIKELNLGSETMLRLSVMAKLIFCAFTQVVCSALNAQLPDSSPRVSLLKLARLFSQAGFLLSAAMLDVSPTHLLSHLISSIVFYEQRSDRQNFPDAVSACSLG